MGLQEEDRREEFDIHIYGERLLERMAALTCADDAPAEALASGALPPLSFGQLVEGAPARFGVSRSFSSLLQLINNGNVRITKLGTSNDQFELVLLDRVLPHKARFAGLAVPNAAAAAEDTEAQEQRRQEQRQGGGRRGHSGAKAAAADQQELELDGAVEAEAGLEEAENVSQQPVAAAARAAGKPAAGAKAKAGAKAAKRRKA